MNRLSLSKGFKIIVCGLVMLAIVYTSAIAHPQPVYAADIARIVPAEVTAGQTFDVIIQFSAPADNFNAVGLTDFAPSGWIVNAVTERTFPTPEQYSVTANRIDYIWFGPFPKGTIFTVTYAVTVPVETAPGNFSFGNPDSHIEYYLASNGPFTDKLFSANQIEVVSPIIPLPTQLATPTFSTTPNAPAQTTATTTHAENLPFAVTQNVIFISASESILRGALTNLGIASQVQVNFEWGNDTAYGNVTPIQTLTSPGEFSNNLSGLKPMTEYHYRIKVVGNTTVYSSDSKFTTPLFVANDTPSSPIPTTEPPMLPSPTSSMVTTGTSSPAGDSLTPSPSQNPSPEPSNKFWLIWLIGGVVIVAAGVTLILFTQRRGR